MTWLGDSAALVILSFDVDAESPILVEGRRWADSPMVMSHQAYGPEVAVPRLLELLADYSLPATFFVPGYTADHYPEAIVRIAEAGHEIGHHGYSHHSPLALDEAGERADLERGLQALGSAEADRARPRLRGRRVRERRRGGPAGASRPRPHAPPPAPHRSRSGDLPGLTSSHAARSCGESASRHS